MPAALNRAQHHPDSMRPRRHCSCSATRGTSQRRRSNDGIAVEQSRHSVPPTECRDYSAERSRGALERGGVSKRPSSRNKPFVTPMPGVEMQPATSRTPQRDHISGSFYEPPLKYSEFAILTPHTVRLYYFSRGGRDLSSNTSRPANTHIQRG